MPEGPLLEFLQASVREVVPHLDVKELHGVETVPGGEVDALLDVELRVVAEPPVGVGRDADPRRAGKASAGAARRPSLRRGRVRRP